VHKVWDGVSMSTNSVVSAAKLEVIKQWLKKTARLFFFFGSSITWCSIAVHGRLTTTSSLQFSPQETKTPLIGREIQLESIEIKEKSK